MNVPVHESKVTNAQSGVEPQAYFEGASVDPTEAPTTSLAASVDHTEAHNASTTSVVPCRASLLGMSRSSGRPALVTRHARPSRRWIAALLPRQQASRCRCDRTWPRPALWASSAARITWPQSAASTRSMYASCGPSRRSRVRTLCTVPCYRLRSYRGWLDLSDDMRSQDPPSFPHEVVKSGLAPFLSRLWDRDLDGNPWTAAER